MCSTYVKQKLAKCDPQIRADEGVVAVVNTKNRTTKNQLHSRYKVVILRQDSVIRTLGVPDDRPRLRVLEITRRELRSVPTATHAIIRALDGTEHTVYAKDSWLRCQLKALQL